MMPRWYPGKREGKEEQQSYIMSIKFPFPEDFIEEEVFIMTEQPPKYIGGEETRLKFIQENLVYPQEAKEKRIQGTVYVGFIVEKDGSLSDIKVPKGIGGGCDKEAVRVVLMMPNWEPAKVRGKEVRMHYNMPIKFTLTAEKRKTK
jgi:protein TonB